MEMVFKLLTLCEGKSLVNSTPHLQLPNNKQFLYFICG